MYATAYRCGHPKCRRPLYRVNDVTGDFTLNSTVAHIHARRENGPRWNAKMTEAENRAESNLILLCLEHSSEVDDVPDDYPANDMRAWKVTVRAEYDEAHRHWDLTEDQVAEVFAASFEFRELARTTVESESLTQCIRLGATLIEQAKSVRSPAQRLVAAWVALGKKYSGQTMVWDDNGELVRIPPPEVERQQFRAEMIAALSDAEEQVRPIVRALAAELRALQATNTALTDWCNWVEREARSVLQQVITATLEEALDADAAPLSEALDALSAKWRGVDAPTPPMPPDPAPEPEPDAAAAARGLLIALATRARPWTRVTTRPYDPELYDELVAALPYAATLPPTVGNMAVSLDSVARLAAAVTRNADDSLMAERSIEASLLEPLASAVALLNNLAAVASEGARSGVANQATGLAAQRLSDQSWVGEDLWDANLMHCGWLLASTASQTSIDHVRALVAGALTTVAPGYLLFAGASWREQLATLDFQHPGTPVPYIRQIPDWLPQDELETAVREAWSDLSDDDLESSDLERRLAAEFLRHIGTL